MHFFKKKFGLRQKRLYLCTRNCDKILFYLGRLANNGWRPTSLIDILVA